MIKKLSSMLLLTFLVSGCSQPNNKDKENIKLKTSIDSIVQKYNKKLQSKEIIVSIMDSHTGKIIYINNIKSATQFTFEPGSIIKPISIAVALNNKKIKDNEQFFAYNEGIKDKNGNFPRGKYKVGRWTIRDFHQFNKHYLTVDDIVMFSSNIGTALIANRLSGQEFLEGFQNFGLSKKTGIDLPYEREGLLHKLYQYSAGDQSDNDKPNVFKTTDSYGQGISVTFIQMIKAYSVFNNDGIIVTPYIKTKTEQDNRVLSKDATKHIKQLLIETVKSGTGSKAFIEGLEIGGKTGTANIVENGKYQKKYMSSFFGFVNDKHHKYIIGVTVNNPISTGEHWYYYYASYSAVPVFKEIVKVLEDQKFLTIN